MEIIGFILLLFEEAIFLLPQWESFAHVYTEDLKAPVVTSFKVNETLLNLHFKCIGDVQGFLLPVHGFFFLHTTIVFLRPSVTSSGQLD